MFCLDTEPFRKLTIVGADSFDKTLVVCRDTFANTFILIDVFKKCIAYKIDLYYNTVHNINCHFKQFGFLCNEMFMMCRNLSGRSFMKCFQLESKFPSLLDLARSVLLRTYSLDEFKKMNLPRVCMSILHLPFIKIVN